MSNLSLTAEDVRMIVEDWRQLALVRQALVQIFQMFTWNAEQGHWVVHPAWQNWLDEVMALRQQQREHPACVAGRIRTAGTSRWITVDEAYADLLLRRRSR